MEEHYRTFVALRPSPELVEAAARLQRQLAARLPRGTVRWVRADQLHLTLRFLGDVPVAQVTEIEQAVNSACAGLRATKLALATAGAFPHAQRPRVLWIGVEGDLAWLAKLQQRVDDQTQAYGVPPERRGFQPHLTVGRVNTQDAGLARVVGEQVRALELARLGEWLASEIHLVRSRLTPTGPIYTDLATFRFAQPA